jgi:hypothetical protein
MSDTKTKLRETSVLVGTSDCVLKKQNSFDKTIFLEKVREIILTKFPNFIKNISIKEDFTQDEKKIISNGYKLANYIVNKLNIKDIKSLYWIADENYKSLPFDIKINDFYFSLKEDSNILENMGLYKLVNVLTKSNYKKLHIYEDFAKQEYEDWFNYTYSGLVNFLNTNLNGFEYIKESKKSKIVMDNQNVRFTFQSKKKSISANIPKNLQSTDRYNSLTSNELREYCLAKWINRHFSSDEKYNMLKAKASEVAGKNLVEFIKKNLYIENELFDFFRIYETEYYYAKVTDSYVNLFRVPKIQYFKNNLKMQSICYSVPKSQLNIITTFINNRTKGFIELRNECRFSHGQFTSTPEAKLYFGKGTDLTHLYERL